MLQQTLPIDSRFIPDWTAFERSFFGIDATKSFGILDGSGEGVGAELVIGKVGNLVIEKRKTPEFQEVRPERAKAPEARYAYYRRCQKFRRNGGQCKAPAMKGEQICYKHAEQQATEDRRVRERRELLSRP